MFKELTKAVLGTVVQTPVALAMDVITMGGECNGRHEPYTASAVKNVLKNLDDAVKPEEE